MNELTIKEKIIKTLLESPKTTGKIAIELGYIDDKGHGRYNVIKPDLNTLEQYGFIHRIELNKKSIGAPATTYDIVYEMSVLGEIVEKYASLIPVLQKNSRVLILLRQKLPFFKDVGTESVEDLRTIVMGMCGLSPTFFKYYLLHDTYFKQFLELWREINKGDERRDFIKLDPNAIGEIYDAMFLHAVITDKLNGDFNPAAIDEIRDAPTPSRYIQYSRPIRMKKSELEKRFKKGNHKNKI